ncbi:MAG: HDIG domain-containing protein [Kiritimatiellae bacterium]|nr:HDIG domain-containing protein [Kiritimatiellia bacterium]
MKRQHPIAADFRRPGSDHPHRRTVAHLGLLLGIWVLSMALLNLGGLQVFSGLTVGQRAPETLLAETDFTCVDLSATELARKEAADQVLPVFRVSMDNVASLERTLLKLADKAVAARADPAAADNPMLVEQQLHDLATARDAPLTGAEAAALFPPGQERLAATCLVDALHTVAAAGIAPDDTSTLGDRIDLEGSAPAPSPAADDPAAPPAKPSANSARPPPTYRTLPVAGLARANAALHRFYIVVSNALAKADCAAVLPPSLRPLAADALRPNLTYYDFATSQRRKEAADQVADIPMTIRKGTPLVDRDDEVTPQVIEKVNAHNRRWAKVAPRNLRLLRHIGDAALMLIMLAICAIWLRSSCPEAIASSRRKWLLATFAVAAVAIATLFRYISINNELVPQWLVAEAVPMSILAILSALLLPASAALALGLWTAFATAITFNRNFVLLLMGFAAFALVVSMLQGVRKRSQVLRAGLCVGLLKAALALAIAAMNPSTPAELLTQLAAALCSGLFAAIFAILVLPLIEWAFSYTTDISLLEYGDMSHPLLRRLALEAPGTYHHSLMVATIGQAAADVIHADGLLVAVAAYFHDIGKLSKTEYFTENQHGGANPHDDLEPTMSAMILHSHVKEGVALARRYRLPRPIVEAIATHHGTTVASYFYRIALRRLQDADEPVPPAFDATFRYDGPRPWTREQAILMLSDSVEAASRSLEKPTPAKIADLVANILREKAADHQLDDCPLTQRDLSAIRDSLVFSLTNILHGRSPYPSENPPPQPPAGAPAKDSGTPAPRPAADPPGVS